MARTWHRWLPAGAVVVLIAGTVGLTSQAGAVDLPDKSPEDVLTMLAEHEVQAFSGSFETSTSLGLPMPADLDLGPGGPDLDDAELALPGHATPGGAGGAAGPDVLAALELLTGDNTGRIFVGGPGIARFQHLDGMDERNVVVNERDVWFYDSATNEAAHLLLPDPADLPGPGEFPGFGDLPGAGDGLGELPAHPGHPEFSGELPTPEQLAAMAVEALEPSTEVTVGQHEQVAGRDAYTLVLLPRAPETLVESVTIAVDGETGFPLGLTVTARGQAEPALHAAYTDIDFTAPDASLFDFAPPAGAVVAEEVLELPDPETLAKSGPRGGDGPARFGWGAEELHGDGTGDFPLPQLIGEGWGAVVVMPLDDVPSDPLLDQFTEPVDGGRLLSTALLTVLLTDDGRVLAGAVTPEHLLDLAGR